MHTQQTVETAFTDAFRRWFLTVMRSELRPGQVDALVDQPGALDALFKAVLKPEFFTGKEDTKLSLPPAPRRILVHLAIQAPLGGSLHYSNAAASMGFSVATTALAKRQLLDKGFLEDVVDRQTYGRSAMVKVTERGLWRAALWSSQRDKPAFEAKLQRQFVKDAIEMVTDTGLPAGVAQVAITHASRFEMIDPELNQVDFGTVVTLSEAAAAILGFAKVDAPPWYTAESCQPLFSPAFLAFCDPPLFAALAKLQKQRVLEAADRVAYTTPDGKAKADEAEPTE